MYLPANLCPGPAGTPPPPLASSYYLQLRMGGTALIVDIQCCSIPEESITMQAISHTGHGTATATEVTGTSADTVTSTIVGGSSSGSSFSTTGQATSSSAGSAKSTTPTQTSEGTKRVPGFQILGGVLTILVVLVI